MFRVFTHTCAFTATSGSSLLQNSECGAKKYVCYAQTHKFVFKLQILKFPGQQKKWLKKFTQKMLQFKQKMQQM